MALVQVKQMFNYLLLDIFTVKPPRWSRGRKEKICLEEEHSDDISVN